MPVVAGSVGLHAIVLVGISQCEIEPIEIEPRSALPPGSPPVEVALVESPLQVVLVEPPPVEVEPLVGRPAATAPGSTITGGVGTNLRDTTATTATTTAGATGHESMRMRGRRHDLELPGGVLDRLIASTTPPPSIAHDARLHPSGGGEHVIHDAVTTLRVERDGTAHLHDHPDVTARIVLPIATFDQMRRGLGEHLTAWRDDPYHDQRAGRVQDLPRHVSAVPGACESWGDPTCAPPDNRPMKSLSGDGTIIPTIAGKADLTGWLHRKFIGDPYASRKRALLDTTREARAQIGATYRREQRDRAAELAQRNLVALWQATADPAERKAALFALWDECAETEDADGEAGARARAIVLGWIRAKLPAGSPHAFTAGEIAQLDATRTSRQHFVPY